MPDTFRCRAFLIGAFGIINGMDRTSRIVMICALIVIVPVLCHADPPRPSESVPADPITAAFEAIEAAQENARRVNADIVLTGNRAYGENGFYAWQNDLQKAHLMKAVGARDAMAVIADVRARQNMERDIMARLRVTADIDVRRALIDRLQTETPLADADAAAEIDARIAAIRERIAAAHEVEGVTDTRIGALESLLAILRRNRGQNQAAIDAGFAELTVLVKEIEAAHEERARSDAELHALQDYARAQNKEVKITGIMRGMVNDMGDFNKGMKALKSEMRKAIDARDLAAMQFHPGQSFGLKPSGPGASLNMLNPGLAGPLAQFPFTRPESQYRAPAQTRVPAFNAPTAQQGALQVRPRATPVIVAPAAGRIGGK